MRNIHIALVGGQPVPVYIGIDDDTEATLIVLICSKQSKVEAERIKEQFPDKEVRIVESSPVELKDIEHVASTLSKEFKNDSVRVNLTSGTKLWTIGFFRSFLVIPNSEFIYVDQNNVITNIQTHKTTQAEIGIKKQIELYGSPLISYCDIEEYSEEDFKMMKEVEMIRNFNPIEFTSMTKNVKEEKIEDGDVLYPQINNRTIYDRSFIECHPDSNSAFVSMWNGETLLEKELKSEHLFSILLHTGWFELMIAKELSRIDKVSKVWLNCKLQYSGGDAKNEIDIIVKYKQRLIFVECKTMIFDNTDIDKFRSAVRNFSGTSTMGLFVTYDSPSKKNHMKFNHAMEKCKDNDLQTFNLGLYQLNPKEHLSIEDIIDKGSGKQNKR